MSHAKTMRKTKCWHKVIPIKRSCIIQLQPLKTWSSQFGQMSSISNTYSGDVSDGDGNRILPWGSIDVERHCSKLPALGVGTTYLTRRAHPVLVHGYRRPPHARGGGQRWWRRLAHKRPPDVDAGFVEPTFAGVTDNGGPRQLGEAAGRARGRRVPPPRYSRVLRWRRHLHRRTSGRGRNGRSSSQPPRLPTVVRQRYLAGLVREQQLGLRVGGRLGLGWRRRRQRRRRSKNGGSEPARGRLGNRRRRRRRRRGRLVEVDVEMWRAIHGEQGIRVALELRLGFEFRA